MRELSCEYCFKHFTHHCPWGLYTPDDDLCDDYESREDAEYSYYEIKQELRRERNEM